jgi:hypothetical protein
MKCGQARRLFGSYWDDETTQAEREWLEAHLGACVPCRQEYEEFSRAVEIAGALPRLEAAPDLLDRVLARTRRVAPAPDRFPAASPHWVSITAAAALAALVVSLVLPWLGALPRGHRTLPTGNSVRALREPEIVSPVAARGSARLDQSAPAAGRQLLANASGAAISDSLFDHSEDVEFILDPVTLHRGRATVSRSPNGVQGEKAVISF